MMDYVREVRIPIDRVYNVNAFFAKQQDYRSRYFKIILTKGGRQIDRETLGDVTRVDVAYKRGDGQVKAFDGEVDEDGTLILPLPKWALEIAEDTVVADIMLFHTDGEQAKLLRSSLFRVYVQTSNYILDKLDPDADVLASLIGEVEYVKDYLLSAVPYVGDNGNWWIGDVDSGTKAQGPQGYIPYVGENDNWWINGVDTEKPSIDHKTAASMNFELNPETYEVTLTLYNKEGETLDMKKIDLPIELLVSKWEYDSESKKIKVTYQSGNEIEIPLSDFASGLVNSVNGRTGDVTVTLQELGGYAKPEGGIILDDLEQSIQEAIAKAETALQKVTWTDVLSKPDFHKVATSGSYTDLNNKPALHAVALSGSYEDLTDTPELADVALSGEYSDLLNAPQLAKVATSGDYKDLLNLPTIEYPVTSVNGKTGEVVVTAEDLSLARVATTGSYNDLLNKPVITFPVTSVNDKVGAVRITLDELGGYAKPASGIPATDFTESVQKSLQAADNAASLVAVEKQRAEGVESAHDARITATEEKNLTQDKQITDTYALAADAKSIAQGRAKAKTFATTQAMLDWLAIPGNAETLNVGDNLFIEDVGVPDYWWTGSTYAVLETQKVDLSAYALSSQVDAAKSELESSFNVKLAGVTQQAETALSTAESKYAKPEQGIPIDDLSQSLRELIEAAAGFESPVTSVNGKTGAVTLTIDDFDVATVAKTGKYGDLLEVPSFATVATSGKYSDLIGTPTIPTIPTDLVKFSTQELTSEQQAQVRTNIGAGTSSFSGSYNDLTDRPQIKYPVTSVQGRTGAVTITADDLELANIATSGDYNDLSNKPEIPQVPSWAMQPTKPTYTKTEVGLGNVDNVKQYSTSNPPPYPVTSVNEQTGAVKIDVPHPVYYELAGDAMADTGGVGQTYTVALTNLTPQTPTPVVGDIVVFNTSESMYIGTITQTQAAEVLVAVKLEVKGGVVSVNSKTGVVTLTKEDVGLGNVPNTDTTNASNITSGTLAKARLSSDVIASLGRADSALQTVPASSQTVLGGVKVYVDSSGYLCIDT